MFTKIMISSLVFLSVFTAQGQALTATQILNQIHTEYGQRFDSSGRYIDDQNLTNKFKASQLNAIQTLRQNKMIGQSFQIRNSAMADLIVTVSIVQEQNLNFAGLLIERSKYDSPNSDALLRLFNFPILNGGMTMFTLNGATVIQIKSNAITTETGGSIALKYPTDFKSNQFSNVILNIARTNNGFVFLSPKNVLFSKMNLDVWYSIFSQNFGVKGVTFQ